MSVLLPRFNAVSQRLQDTRKVERIVQESSGAEPARTVARATLPGDTRRLRGIPCVARGVSGVSPGSDPRGVIR